MRLIRILLLIFCSGLLTSIASAQPRAASPAPSPASSPSASSTCATLEYTLPPDKLAKSKTLYDLSGRLRLIGTVWSFVVLLGILYLGVAARYGAWAGKGSRYSFLQALIAIPLLLLTIDVLDWPLAAYSHHISLQYGLSVQGWGSWWGDVLKGEAINIVIGIVALWLLVFLIRRSSRRWWFYSWLIALPFIVFLVFISPFVIEPMFNKFEPLEKTNPQLVEAIEKVTQRGGLNIPRDRMFLMKASEKTTELNAYVTGLGASKRVVVWDNTIKKMTVPETQFVFGHEMGHYVLNHIYWGLAASCMGLLVGLYLLYLLSGWLMPRVHQRWHIPELGSWAALPMILLIFAVLSFIAQPIGSAFSRMLEHNADIYGLEVTHGLNQNSQEVAAHAFQVLGEVSLDYPHPSKFVVFWYYDHPSIPERVRFAHNYDPWDKREQPKYVK